MTNSSYYGTSRGNPYRRYATEELLRDLSSPQLVGEVRAEIEAEIARRAAKMLSPAEIMAAAKRKAAKARGR